jgi:hypothetical protein
MTGFHSWVMSLPKIEGAIGNSSGNIVLIESKESKVR